MTAAAEAAGVLPRMRLGEALATCPQLVLVDPDPAAAELAWEEIVRSLEDAGFSVEPAGLGVAYFETRGVERLYGGLEPALKRALAAAGAHWDARIGAAGRRFAALAAASVAKPGSCSSSATTRWGSSSHRSRSRCCRSSGSATTSSKHSECESLDSLPGSRVAPSPNVWGRTAGAPGAWREAAAAARVRGRRPPAELAESLEFPEAIGNELTLRRALGAIVETALARPERATASSARLRSAARLVGGGSWRRTLTLREPSADADRIRVALAPRLAELPAPVLELRLELVELTEPRAASSSCSPRRRGLAAG